MSLWQWDYLRYHDEPPRDIECGVCKDSRTTAADIDKAGNVGVFPAYAVFPWSVIVQQLSPMQVNDVRDQYERDRLAKDAVVAYMPPIREKYATDYPGDAHTDRPQGLSFMAAAIVAARRAAGIADGSTNEDGSAAQ